MADLLRQDDLNVKISGAQNELEELRGQEADLYAEIGRQAFENAPEDWPQAEQLQQLQAGIAQAQDTLDLLKAEKVAAEAAAEAAAKAAEEAARAAAEAAKAAEEAARIAREAEEAKYRCKNCDTQNPEGTRFCQECGTPLSAPAEPPKPAFCTSCGAALAPGMRFCGGCGAKIGE